MRLRFILPVLLISGALATTATAAPIAYDEATSVDLSDALPATLLILDVGANTISGTQSATGAIDRDSFAFTVPAGTVLSSITYRFLLAETAGNIAAITGFLLDNGNAAASAPFIAELDMNLQNGSPIVFPGAPLGPGTYGLTNDILIRGANSIWSSVYQWTLQVEQTSSTPEPASMLLLGSGVAGLIVRRAQRRRA